MIEHLCCVLATIRDALTWTPHAGGRQVRLEVLGVGEVVT